MDREHSTRLQAGIQSRGAAVRVRRTGWGNIQILAPYMGIYRL